MDEQRAAVRPVEDPLPGLVREMAALEPSLVSLAGGPEMSVSSTDALSVSATPASGASVQVNPIGDGIASPMAAGSLVVVASWRGRLPSPANQARLRDFVAARLHQPLVRLIHVLEASPNETRVASGRTISARKTRH